MSLELPVLPGHSVSVNSAVTVKGLRSSCFAAEEVNYFGVEDSAGETQRLPGSRLVALRNS